MTIQYSKTENINHRDFIISDEVDNELPPIVSKHSALVFDAFTGCESKSLKRSLENQFTLVGQPGHVLSDDVRAGDIQITRVMGEGTLARASRLESIDIRLSGLQRQRRLDYDRIILREIVPPKSPYKIDYDSEGVVESVTTPRSWFVSYKPVVQLSNRRQARYFIDGETYCAALYQDIMAARHHIYLTGLHFMHDFGLLRPQAASSSWIKLADLLLQKARAGIKIYLVVNQFWLKEGAMLGYWDTNQRFHLFDRTTPLSNQILRHWSETPRDDDRISASWERLANILRPRIAEGGVIQRYLPATAKLFSELTHENIKCRTDIHPGFIMHSHHQKSVVIDDNVAYVGGIDLTHADGDRWDNHQHVKQKRLTVDRDQHYWHDIHGRLEGSAAKIVAQNFHDRWRNGRLYIVDTSNLQQKIRQGIAARRPVNVTITRDRTNQSEAFRQVRPVTEQAHNYSEADILRFSAPKVQLVRSMPDGRNYSVPGSGNWERSAKDAYIAGIRAARHSIYIENQWITDESVWGGLLSSVQQRRGNSNFRVVIMLPNEILREAGLAANQNLLFEWDMFKLFWNCRDSQTVSIFSLVNRDRKQIYVHSKSMIVDDIWSLIGSANAGGMSLEGVRQYIIGDGSKPDTELSFITLDRQFSRNMRLSTWRDHLQTRQITQNFNSGVTTMRQRADSARHRIRHSPHAIRAFGNIDLRIFSYSATEIVVHIAREGVQFAQQYLVALNQIHNLLQREVQRAVSSAQRQVYEQIVREFDSMNLQQELYRLIVSGIRTVGIANQATILIQLARLFR